MTLEDRAIAMVDQMLRPDSVGRYAGPETIARAVLALVREEQMKGWLSVHAGPWWSSQAAQVRADE